MTDEAELVAKQVKRLSIIARQRVASFLSGSRKSLFRGQGTDFVDLREYVPGDELKYIDWRATAKRVDTLIVRDYEIEKNTNVVLLLDASASMLIGKSRPRIVSATEAIASLTHAAIENKDFIGFGAFSTDLETFVHPKAGKSHEFFIYRQLLNVIPKGETNIGDALKEVATTLKRRSLILVVTDLHDDIEKTIHGFRIARALKHEVQLLQVTDFAEFVLPENISKIKYFENGTSPKVLDFSDPLVKGKYFYNLQKQVDQIKAFKRNLRGMKVRIVETTTDELVEKLLLSYYSTKARR